MLLQLYEATAEIAERLRVELNITEPLPALDSKLDEIDGDDDAFKLFDETVTYEADEVMQRVDENLAESVQNTSM